MISNTHHNEHEIDPDQVAQKQKVLQELIDLEKSMRLNVHHKQHKQEEEKTVPTQDEVEKPLLAEDKQEKTLLTQDEVHHHPKQETDAHATGSSSSATNSVVGPTWEYQRAALSGTAALGGLIYGVYSLGGAIQNRRRRLREDRYSAQAIEEGRRLRDVVVD